MNAPHIKISSVGNVFTRMMVFANKGDTEIGHTHNFDHATLVAHGAVLVRAKGKETVFEAPSLIWIAKDVQHELVALQDGTVCACIHGLRDKYGDIVDPSMIPEGSLSFYREPSGVPILAERNFKEASE